MDIDLEDLQLADQYQALALLPQADDNILPSIEFDDVPSSQAPSGFTTDPTREAFINPMPPPQSRRPSQDMSEALPHPRVQDEDPDPFMLALGLWCEEAGISRTQYSSLREILRMLEPHPALNRLPTSYAPLRRRTRGWLPQIQLRRALLSLNVNKMASSAEQQKKRTTQGPTKEHLYFFDPLDLFKRILQSELTAKMHFGFGEFKTHPIELWQSSAWTASVRTTSGHFARYRNGSPVFPSDWVVYECASTTCHVQHLGRVVEVGLDQRDDILGTERGKVKLKIQHAFWNHEIPVSFAAQQFGQHEVMLEAKYSFIDERAVLHRQSNVVMHYDNGPLPQPTSTEETLLCRSLLNSNGWLQPLAFSAPNRGELELKAYGRDYFCDYFDSSNGNECLSLPYLLFLDGFGLYRNSYRSLMGVYLLLASFCFKERMRRVNVYPLTLGPHGSNLNDVLDALSSLRNLDKGVVLELPQPTRVCIFPLCTIGDMPQQQANAGFKSQRANLGCRMCLVPSESRGNLEYDIVKNGRFHYQTMQQRREMGGIRAIAKKEAFASRWGLSSEEPALMRLFPALDIILTRPSDPAHSEYAGLCKQLHQLLLEAILTPTATQSYATALRQWPFAPGFARIQSPIHHLKSYSLSEHARWIVVIPALLRCWLEKQHLQPYYLSALTTRLAATNGAGGFTATETIVRAFGFVARSTSFLMTENLKGREQLLGVIKKARSEFQILLTVAAVAANMNPRSRSTTPVQRDSIDRAGSAIPSVEDGIQSELPLSSSKAQAQKAQEYTNDQRRPNVHTALHYEATMREYGMPSNVNVLIGEDKHRYVKIRLSAILVLLVLLTPITATPRWFKKVVYQTNHINVEKLLLEHERLRQSIRLLLMNTWRADEPQITSVVKDLYRKCPTLFDTLLSRSEQESLRSSLIEHDNEDDEIVLQSDDTHKLVTATGRLRSKYCREVLQVPLRASDSLMSTDLKSQLRSAFANDYSMHNVVYFGVNSFQWCKKIGFTSR